MIKDIHLPPVRNVTLAVVREKNNPQKEEWYVYLINNNEVSIENTLVASTGYGEKNGEEQKTSTLRHFLQTVNAKSTVLVEPIDSSVFHLNNEYWVSYCPSNYLFIKMNRRSARSNKQFPQQLIASIGWNGTTILVKTCLTNDLSLFPIPYVKRT